MSNKPLAGKRILITNDDGINAPGLKVTQAIAAALSDDVWVVAPEGEQSGAGHSLTLHAPLRLRKLEDQVYAVQGTPTDCVVMALDHVMLDHRPDLILSGVNRGMNVADDVTYSGTIAAAMEGCMFNVPSIALSQMLRPGQAIHWQTAEKFGIEAVTKLVAAGWEEGTLMNVNFPPVPADEVKGMRVTRQGRRDINALRIEERKDTRFVPYFWIGFGREVHTPAPDTDLAALAEGYVSITPLHLNLTHDASLAALNVALTEG